MYVFPHANSQILGSNLYQCEVGLCTFPSEVCSEIDWLHLSTLWNLGVTIIDNLITQLDADA